MSDRNPPPPQDLIGALQDRVHPASGKLLSTRAVSKPKPKKLPPVELTVDIDDAPRRVLGNGCSMKARTTQDL